MLQMRLTSSITLIAFLAAIVGLPVPRIIKKSDEDFPCRYHACGCIDAEMCRTNCCCFKPESTVSSCCRNVRRDSECQKATKKSRDTGEEQAVTLTLEALKCKGLMAVWSNLGILYYSCVRTTIVTENIFFDDRVVLHDHLTPLCYLEPAPPPPRA